MDISRMYLGFQLYGPGGHSCTWLPVGSHVENGKIIQTQGIPTLPAYKNHKDPQIWAACQIKLNQNF
jgi:hypothetical protein